LRQPLKKPHPLDFLPVRKFERRPMPRPSSRSTGRVWRFPHSSTCWIARTFVRPRRRRLAMRLAVGFVQGIPDPRHTRTH
jgi:hypothetical protein